MEVSRKLQLTGFRLGLILVLFTVNPLTAGAIEPDTLFRSDEVIKMELRSDFSGIIGDRTEFQEYQDAELIYFLKGRKPVSIRVMIMARGNFRRNPDNCAFPPLFINFRNGEVRKTIFENQEKIKLVTPCQDEKDLIEEYTIYKMYNRVTDMSLRARLVKMLYFDTGENRRLFERYSFFLEDPDRAALRVKAKVSSIIPDPAELDRENYKKMSVFQYMIGNIDWNIGLKKNIIILKPEDPSKQPYAVPYDFDFSAYVDAGYSVTSGTSEDITKTRRVYQGICFNQYELISTLDLYRKLRVSFESIIQNQKYLQNTDKKKLIRFLDDFYSQIDNDQLIRQVFSGTCQTIKP